jgi:hypothetical protein
MVPFKWSGGIPGMFDLRLRRCGTGHEALCPVSRHAPGILMLVIARAY